MKHLIYISLVILTFTSCISQSGETSELVVGGPCEGCEAIYEYGNRELSPIDTLPKYLETEPKLHISGTVYQKDGKTPAPDIILYIYHTNRDGIYETLGEEEGWGRRHGSYRGWIKTASDGKYNFYTFRPASYPGREIPEHIHITVKEPGKSEYYIEDFVFDDDPLLTREERTGMRKRGGSGIVIPLNKDGILTIERDIILGLNIPDYP